MSHAPADAAGSNRGGFVAPAQRRALEASRRASGTLRVDAPTVLLVDDDMSVLSVTAGTAGRKSFRSSSRCRARKRCGRMLSDSRRCGDLRLLLPTSAEWR